MQRYFVTICMIRVKIHSLLIPNSLENTRDDLNKYGWIQYGTEVNPIRIDPINHAIAN